MRLLCSLTLAKTILLSFFYFNWLSPPSARETSAGNRSIYKFTRERVDSKGFYGRWGLHLMGSCTVELSDVSGLYGRTVRCVWPNWLCSKGISNSLSVWQNWHVPSDWSVLGNFGLKVVLTRNILCQVVHAQNISVGRCCLFWEKKSTFYRFLWNIRKMIFSSEVPFELKPYVIGYRLESNRACTFQNTFQAKMTFRSKVVF